MFLKKPCNINDSRNIGSKNTPHLHHFLANWCKALYGFFEKKLEYKQKMVGLFKPHEKMQKTVDTPEIGGIISVRVEIFPSRSWEC